MDIKEELEYSTIFIGWSPKEINLAYQMLIFLRKVDISTDAFEEYAEFLQVTAVDNNLVSRNSFFIRSAVFEKEALVCPDCGSRMFLYPVNATKCTQIPNKRINSVWSCPNERECGNQVWNHKDAGYYISRMEKVFIKKLESMSREEILAIEIPKDYHKKFKSKCGG